MSFVSSLSESHLKRSYVHNVSSSVFKTSTYLKQRLITDLKFILNMHCSIFLHYIQFYSWNIYILTHIVDLLDLFSSPATALHFLHGATHDTSPMHLSSVHFSKIVQINLRILVLCICSWWILYQLLRFSCFELTVWFLRNTPVWMFLQNGSSVLFSLYQGCEWGCMCPLGCQII